MTLNTEKLNLLLAAIATFNSTIRSQLDGKLAVDGVAQNSDRLGGKTLAEIQALIGDDLEPAVQQLSSDFAAFIARRDNPHAVTKAQVGLGDVENFGVASNAQALDGAIANKLITPANLAAFWADKVGTAPETLDTIQELAAALDNNPDAISALQQIAGDNAAAITALQSSKLDVAAKASAAEVEAGTDDTKYVTAAALAPSLAAQNLAIQANTTAIDDVLTAMTTAFENAASDLDVQQQ